MQNHPHCAFYHSWLFWCWLTSFGVTGRWDVCPLSYLMELDGTWLVMLKADLRRMVSDWLGLSWLCFVVLSYCVLLVLSTSCSPVFCFPPVFLCSSPVKSAHQTCPTLALLALPSSQCRSTCTSSSSLVQLALLYVWFTHSLLVRLVLSPCVSSVVILKIFPVSVPLLNSPPSYNPAIFFMLKHHK